jgi:arylsulfatase A-like enzyme/tetratricopeptide (TPR) repeat protein
MNRKLFLALVCLASVTVLLVAGLRFLSPRPPPLNVLLITLDTTRADRLGCYGYAKAETPALDSLAAAGIRFENAFTQVPLTLPSHTTMLTGLCPPEHGVRVNGRHKLSPGSATLAEILQGHGYRTGAFLACAILDRRFGLDRGFEVYDDRMEAVRQGHRVSDAENPANVVADRALAWLETHRAEPFFCWVHFFDPHPPFDPPEPFRSRFKDPYDGEMAFMDSQVGRLLDFLDRRGLRPRTLIVACGDHGESFGEHQETGHGPLLYEPTMRVPLLVSPPGQATGARQVRPAAALSDLAPTILAALRVRPPPEMRGRNLLASTVAEADPASYGETQYTLYAYGWAELRSLTTTRWRFIEGPDPELYDRAGDPGETRNLVAAEPQVAARMQARLNGITQGMRQTKSAAAPMDAKALATLRSLGYLGGMAGEPSAGTTGTRKGPKAMMPVLNLSQAAEQQASAFIGFSRAQEAVELLQPVIAAHPELPGPRKLLVEALEALDRLADARPHVEAYLAHDPADREMLGRLGKILLAAGRIDESVRTLTHALDTPASVIEPVGSNGVSQVAANLRLDLGLAFSRQGRRQEALRQFERVLAEDPDNFQAHNNLGCMYTEEGKYDQAIRHLKAAANAAPDRPNQQANLATALVLAGRIEEAVGVCENSLKAHPDNGQLHSVLCSALLSLAKAEAALAHGREAARLMPLSSPAHSELGRISLQLGRHSDAEASFRKALELDPGNVDAKTNLASVLSRPRGR